MQKGIKERKSCPDWGDYRQWPASADGISKHWRGEIRKLADQSKKAAEEINQRLPSDGSVASLVRLVKENAERIFEGIGSLQKTGNPFQNIDDRVNEKMRHRRCRKWPQ